MRWIILLLVVFGHGGLVAAARETLHAVLVGDVEDVEIKLSCQADVRRLKEAFRSIAGQTGMHLSLHTCTGKKFSVSSMRKRIRMLHPSAQDTVVFYFSGHGFEDPQAGPWPCVEIESERMRMDTIKNGLKKSNVRLIIVLFDCCNGDGLRQRGQVSMNGHLPGLATLFKASKGVVLACAASRWEPALAVEYGHNRGGVFTTALISAMNTLCMDKKVAWDQVLTLAKEYSIAESSGTQHPFFMVETVG